MINYMINEDELMRIGIGAAHKVVAWLPGSPISNQRPEFAFAIQNKMHLNHTNQEKNLHYVVWKWTETT